MNEHDDAKQDKWIGRTRSECSSAGDIGTKVCQQAVQQAVDEFGKLDILVNNAAEHPQENIADISAQLERTFRTNIFSMFSMTKAALKHLKEGSHH